MYRKKLSEFIHTKYLPHVDHLQGTNEYVLYDSKVPYTYLTHIASTVRIIQGRCGHANKPHEYNLIVNAVKGPYTIYFLMKTRDLVQKATVID